MTLVWQLCLAVGSSTGIVMVKATITSMSGLRSARAMTHSPRSAGWSWRLELEWCERKTLLPGWWLEAGAGVV